MENDCGRAARPYFADPTANTAIGNVMREEREEKREGVNRMLEKMYVEDYGLTRYELGDGPGADRGTGQP